VEGGRDASEIISSFEDLDVYKRLVELHLEVHELSLKFPKYEMYELGSQVRRSSNAIAANIAEGWNNKHSNMYLEGINRALGEMRETRHHINMAYRKGHLTKDVAERLLHGYDECGKMLRGLERSVERSIETGRNRSRSR
jgi:four helix bundle protein